MDAVFLEESKGYDAQQNHAEKDNSANLNVEFGNMYAREVESFCLSVLQGKPLEVPAEEAVRAQRIIEAAYRSNDEKKIIDL